MTDDQLACARQIVKLLFAETRLSLILDDMPTVAVGTGNWINFVVDAEVSRDAILGLRLLDGRPAFSADPINPLGAARSRTTPSLHLTGLDCAGNLRGHVDAYYWAKAPLRHTVEFLRRKTVLPSELLRRLPYAV
jgi:hypothetical protein